MKKISTIDSSTIRFLVGTELFEDITEAEVRTMMGCLGAALCRYEKEEYIFRAGDTFEDLSLLVRGSVRLESIDAWGNVSALAYVEPGDVFAENYACTLGMSVDMYAVATRDSDVLMIDVNRIINTCTNVCAHHTLLLRNVGRTLARKSVAHYERIRHVAPKSIRAKVLEYLSTQSKKTGERSFEISLNRQQLADYLFVDRSALSAELSRMKREGIIDVWKNHFTLKQQAPT